MKIELVRILIWHRYYKWKNKLLVILKGNSRAIFLIDNFPML